MFLSLLKISVRNILRKKLYAWVNILGLGITIAASYLLYAYVGYELSYDNFQKDQVYRVNLETIKNEELVTSDSRTPPVLGNLMKAEIPGVEEITRLPIFGEAILAHKDLAIRERQILVAEPSLFDVLKYKMKSGDVATALDDPFSIMISSSLADKIFPSEDPLYKTISINNPNLDGSHNFKITGVYEDQPGNCHLRPNILMSYATVLNLVSPEIDNSWFWNNLYTYVLLSEEHNHHNIELTINDLVKDRFGDELEKMGVDWQFNLQPISNIYIDAGHEFEFASGGNKKLVNYLTLAGIFMLLVAYINFVNIFTAQATVRFREVAIRKINGANAKHVTAQFIIQASMLIFIAMFVAFTLVQLFQGNILSYFEFPYLVTNDLQKWSVLCLLSFVVAVLAGSYATLLLTSFKPVASLKGEKNIKVKGVLISKLLVIVQFAASLILIYGTIIIYQQLIFTQSFDVGFSSKNKLIIKSPRTASTFEPTGSRPLKEALLSLSSVEKVSWLDEIPGNEIYWKAFDYECSNGEKLINPSRLVIGEDYFKLFEIDELAGRSFKFEVDSFLSGVILNRKSTEMLGFENPAKALDKYLTIDGHRLPIVGIREDYFQESLKSSIKPLVFHYRKGKLNYVALSIAGHQSKNAIMSIKSTYEKLFPDSPFEYYWLDEFYNKQYESDFAFEKLFRSFALLVIMVSAMGIFALSLLSVSRKIVEIGIRKILGASVGNIIHLLVREYLILIGLASLVGIPVGYYLMNNWLNNYVHAINPALWMLIIPILLVGTIILIAIGYNVVKVAFTKPVNVIQQE